MAEHTDRSNVLVSTFEAQIAKHQMTQPDGAGFILPGDSKAAPLERAMRLRVVNRSGQPKHRNVRVLLQDRPNAADGEIRLGINVSPINA